MEKSKKDIANDDASKTCPNTNVFMHKTIGDLLWSVCMSKLMTEIDFDELEKSATEQQDCIVEIKLRIPKAILAGYLRAMDKTTIIARKLIKDIDDDQLPPFLESNEKFIQTANGAFFIAGMHHLISEEAKKIAKMIEKVESLL